MFFLIAGQNNVFGHEAKSLGQSAHRCCSLDLLQPVSTNKQTSYESLKSIWQHCVQKSVHICMYADQVPQTIIVS